MTVEPNGLRLWIQKHKDTCMWGTCVLRVSLYIVSVHLLHSWPNQGNFDFRVSKLKLFTSATCLFHINITCNLQVAKPNAKVPGPLLTMKHRRNLASRYAMVAFLLLILGQVLGRH